MSQVIVLGAGPIGATTAQHFSALGDQVTVVTRSGSGPEGAGIERVALDVSDSAALSRLATGAEVIVNAVNLPYDAWESGWPPIHRSVLAAARHSGAVLTLVGNLYGYAVGQLPMTPDLPLRPPSRKGAVRARMWAELHAAHTAGDVRALEVRASDYVGPQVTSLLGAHGGPRLVDPVLSGRRAWVVGDPDAVHTWTAVEDIATTIATLSRDERAWGRAWHVPSAPPRSFRELATDYARAGGRSSATVSAIPRAALRAVGLVQPQMRELVEMLYQFEAPFVADHEETTEVVGLEPTPWAETVAAVVAASSARRGPHPAVAPTR